MRTTDKKGNRVIYSYLATYIIIGCFIAFATYQYVRNFERHFKTNLENQLGLIADLKVYELERWRDDQKETAESLSENEAFVNIVKRYFKNPNDPHIKSEIQVWIKEFQTEHNYNAVILTDSQLTKKIFFPETAERQKAYISPGNIDSLHADKLVFEDFYRDDFKQKVFLKVLIPILDAHQLIGVIELRIDPKTTLYPILANWPMPSKTSETLILRREGNQAVYLNELRFQTDSVLNLKVPLANKNVTAVRAILGQEGSLDNVIDYRGKAVIAYTRKVPNSPWYLVVKEDVSEVYAPFRLDIWLTMIFSFGIFFTIGMGLLFLWRHQQTQFYKERIKSAEELQKLNFAIDNSQEIVFLTDKDGIITYINPKFTKIYGFTAEEVVGVNTPRILNSGLYPKEYFESFWEALLNKQSLPKTEYFNRCKDGKLIEIEGSANPVMDQNGNIIGFLGVQRDITERKRSELEKQVMFDITHGFTITSNFDELLKTIHQSLGKVLYTDNIFVALYDQKTELFSFPYWVDEFDPIPEPVAMRKSLSAYVFRTGKTLLFSEELFEKLEEQNEVELVGSPSPSWVGVPLRTPARTIGVLVLQHYKKENVYSESDLQFLDSVGNQIAIAIESRLAVRALRESEIKMKVILESTADGILAIDGKGKVIKTNKRFAELWRIPQALIDSEDNNGLFAFVLDQLANSDEFVSEEQKLYQSTEENLDILQLKDGRTFERYSLPMTLDDSTIGRVWSLRDITDRKRAEKTLRNERLLLRTVVDNLPDLIYSKDIDCRKTFSNLTDLHQCGVNSEAEILGKTDFDLYPKELAEGFYADDQNVLKTGRPILNREEYMIDSAGQKRWMLTSKLPMKDEHGNIIGLVGIGRDFTERKVAEEGLHESEIKMKVILESTADGILAVDGNGKIIKTNKRFAELFQIPQALIDSEDNQSLINFVLNQLTNTDELISTEQKLFHSTDEDLKILKLNDGRTFERYSLPMIMNDSSIGRVWSLRDITDRICAEQEIKNSQEQLRKFAIHIQNAREQDKILLATQLDNELGQMLVALKMDIGMLKNNVAKGNIDTISADLFAKLDQAHNLIGNSINNTMKIMNDLRYEVLYLMGFVEAVNLYISEFEKENKISCTFENTILKLDIDEKEATSLFRIFQNAMSNIFELSEATKVKINLYKTEDKLILEIWDNGIGFDPEKLSNPYSNRLIYMKERALLLNGELQIESLQNQGTSIRVKIPYISDTVRTATKKQV